MTYRLVQPISPRASFSYPDETRGTGGDVVDIEDANTAMEMDNHKGLKECFPVEQSV